MNLTQIEPSAALADLQETKPERVTIVVLSGDMDRVMAAFIIATGAAAMGMPVTMFFTFWGLNAIRKSRGLEELDAVDFLALVRDKMKLLDMDETLMNRPVNEGFSGGEKKRNEIFQMAVLDPKLAILDETDSGLDIDALRTVANGVNSLRSKDRAMIVVTHYQRLLEYIVPDFVHVLFEGRLVKSGGKDLALELERKGYSWIEEEAASAGATR